MVLATKNVDPYTPLNIKVGHIDLDRYMYRSIHGDHVFTELIEPLSVSIWVYGIPRSIKHVLS
jgi:hypothetical protein